MVLNAVSTFKSTMSGLIETTSPAPPPSSSSGDESNNNYNHKAILLQEAGDRAKSSMNYHDASKLYQEAIAFQSAMKEQPHYYHGNNGKDNPSSSSSSASSALSSSLASSDVVSSSQHDDTTNDNMMLLMEPSIKLGVCLCELARYKEAEAILTQCLQQKKDGSDDDHGGDDGKEDGDNVSNSTTTKNVGSTTNQVGTNTAMVMEDEAMMHVRALTALAGLYQAQSKYEEAIALHERAIPIARRVALRAATAAVSVTTSSNTTDAALSDDKNEGDSTSSSSSSISSYPPSSNLDLADNIAGYAETLRKSGNLSAAEQYHREAQAIRTRAVSLGFCTELELAVSYTQLGCTLQAMSAAEQGRTTDHDNANDDDVVVDATNNNNKEEAYQQHHRALTLRYRYLDFSHGLVSESLNYCAESLCALGRGGEGIPLALHAVQIRRSLFGTAHPAYAHTLCVLASCYYSVGRSLEACDILTRCIDICEVALPKHHANMIPNLMVYGMVLKATHRYERAKNVYERAMHIHRMNFKMGQMRKQLEICEGEVEELTERLAAMMEEEEEGTGLEDATPSAQYSIDQQLLSSSTARRQTSDGSNTADTIAETCGSCKSLSTATTMATTVTASSSTNTAGTTTMIATAVKHHPKHEHEHDRLLPSLPTITHDDIQSKGTPIIIFTDIGRDVDDEMALVLLSSLKRQHKLNPIAVITTLSPQKDRAYLARGSLDTMGMAGVPVGVGGRGGVADGVELEVYAADHSRPNSPSIHDCGMELVCRALHSVPNKSAQIVCLASLSDTASLIRDHERLFMDKIKEVVVMGGVNPMDSGETLTPDTAYNNNCDMDSARYVYEQCQHLGMATTTLSRWAAYGCPIRPQLLDELAKTKHMVAANIRRKSKDSIDQLWNKVILPADHPKREKLPARCDVNWFYKTFCGADAEVPSSQQQQQQETIWTRVEKLNMYDPLAVLLCVVPYRELHFDCKTKTVNGVDHIVVGTSPANTGIRNTLSLYKEYSHLFVDALKASLDESEMPLGSEKEPDTLIEETTKILSSQGPPRAA